LDVALEEAPALGWAGVRTSQAPLTTVPAAQGHPPWNLCGAGWNCSWASCGSAKLFLHRLHRLVLQWSHQRRSKGDRRVRECRRCLWCSSGAAAHGFTKAAPRLRQQDQQPWWDNIARGFAESARLRQTDRQEQGSNGNLGMPGSALPLV